MPTPAVTVAQLVQVVSESGSLSVGVLKASAEQKETHSVVLKFG